MKPQIRSKDYVLTNIIEEQLQEYIKHPIPQEKLENAVNLIIHQIRKNSRKQEFMVKIDEEFYWDKESKNLIYQHQELTLTKLEKDFLSLLFSSVNRTFSYDTIFVELWGEVYPRKQECLKTMVKRLRKKLPKNIIKNVFGFGYKVVLT